MMHHFKKLIYKLFKFIGDAFLASNAKVIRDKYAKSHSPIHRYQTEQREECYQYFKEYFSKAMLFDGDDDIRSFSISTALENHNEGNLYLEFGVATGNTINFFSKYLKLKNIVIHGFDNFTGNTENWIGNKTRVKGAWNRGGIPPKVEPNVKLVVGDIQNTLLKFIEDNNNMINFVHIDVNTYETTKFILEKIKHKLTKRCVILFDDYYNLPNWRHGEHAALLKVFSKNEFKYICFHSGCIAGIQLTDPKEK